MAMRKLLVCGIALLLAGVVSGTEKPGYYRFPTIHGTTIVFTAEGDLWTVEMDGGTARRLTSHPGMEAFAEISPDGNTIAFSGEYEGATDVYTMPTAGGVPVRRTYDGGARVVGWTPGGKVLYATARYSTLPYSQLLILDIGSGKAEPVPLAQAADGSFDAAGNTLFFTRLAFQGSHTKRYHGGTAQNIWRYRAGDSEAVPLTKDYEGTSKNPLWCNGRIYFVSDRDGTMNLWSMDGDGHDLQQLTTHKGWDVKSPSADGNRIVYQLGADIRLYDIASKTDRLVPVTLASDFDQLRERWIKTPGEYLTSFALSPSGDRLALTARGQIFVAPAEQGRFVRVTEKNSVRYRSGTFLADGKGILALSDESGETEFVRLPANGVGGSVALTSDATVLRHGGEPSPDGKWVAYSDKNEELWLLDISGKKNTRIMKTEEGGPEGQAWSPDSKWLAYSRPAKNFFTQICLYNVATGTTLELTDDRVDCSNPVWSSDGKWLYFLSDRVFQSVVGSPWGPRQPEPYFDKTVKIYAVALTAGSRFPFLPSDELFAARQGEKKEDKKGSEKTPEQKPVDVNIDAAGLQQRIYEVPLPAGAYEALAMNDKFLFLEERASTYQGKSNLVAVEIKNKEVGEKVLVEDIRGFDLSRDGKKIAVRKGDDFFVIDAAGAPPADLGKTKINLVGWYLTVDPREEFRQMFMESWRLERDYFYDPKLHGVDYKELFEKHRPLVERVTDRDELSDLITNLVGELSALHIFVYGGDVRRSPDKIGVATLGARLSRDGATGGFRIDHIYQGDPDYPDAASPLAQPGVDIQEGDLILGINGADLRRAESTEPFLRNQAGQQTLLHLKSADGKREYDAVVKPMSLGDEENLRYAEWEYTRRLRVEKAAHGDIGYVHLRAMGGSNYTEWVKQFYPVFDRKGLIIDVRGNRGGNIDSWILEKLMRKAWFYWKGRVGKPTWNMQYAFRGHMVVLCNERTASDGEAFSEGFRRLGLGKIIGTRTWGGEIWLSSNNFLVDRGIATAAESGVFGPEGEWLIEGRGVEPDTVVDNLPVATFKGGDAQLDAAVEHLTKLLKEHPVEPPKAPPYPNKAFKY